MPPKDERERASALARVEVIVRGDSGAARRIEKTAVAGRHASSGTRFASKTTPLVFAVVTWPEIVRALSRDAARDAVLGRYRTAGFTPDDFASRRPARESMAEALTRTEDVLELRSGAPSREREAIGDLRRRIEWEICP